MAPTDQAALVAVIKQRLEDRGVNLSGPDGAFEITRRVAWELRDQGAGVLTKTTGNNAHGFAVDIVCFRDGTYADCLVDAGGANTPAWQINGGVIDVSRWMSASNPGDELPAPVPAPTPEPPRPTSDDPLRDAVLQFLEMYGPSVDALEANTNALLRVSDQLAQLGQSGVRVRL